MLVLLFVLLIPTPGYLMTYSFSFLQKPIYTNGNIVYVNDPALEAAPQVITWNEFAAAWIEMDCQYGIIGLERF
jgi:hypothetical protein